MTTCTCPKTGPCRTSSTICPHLVQAQVSVQCDNVAVGQHLCCSPLCFLLLFIKTLYRKTAAAADCFPFPSFLSRSASVCPANRGQNNRPSRDYW